MDLFDNSDSEAEPFGTGLVAPAPILAARITQTDFEGLLETPIRLHEDLSKGCGGQIWSAGELLTKYILRRYRGTDKLRSKRIVELGAGGGLTGLAVATGCDLGDSELFITDMNAMIDLIHKNVQLNGLEKQVKVQLLDWKDPIPDIIAEKPVDIILAADCVYYEPVFPFLEKTLINLVNNNTIVFFCFKKRRRADLTFMKSIKKRLNVREVKDDPEFSNDNVDYEKYSRENLFMYVMTKKA